MKYFNLPNSIWAEQYRPTGHNPLWLTKHCFNKYDTKREGEGDTKYESDRDKRDKESVLRLSL